MMLARSAIRAAFMDHAATIPLAYPLVYPAAPDGTPQQLPDNCIIVSHTPNRSMRPMLDSPAQDHMGFFRFLLLRQKGQHEIVYENEAAIIEKHFMDAVFLSAGGHTLTITRGDVTQGDTDPADSRKWAVPVFIEYRLDA